MQPKILTRDPIITHVANTPFVQVYYTNTGYEVHIKCKDGSVVEHEPFKGDLEGLVAALHLAQEVNAGKFYVTKILHNAEVIPMQKNLLGSSKKGALNG